VKLRSLAVYARMTAPGTSPSRFGGRENEMREGMGKVVVEEREPDGANDAF
jgi:hypothetical protein